MELVPTDPDLALWVDRLPVCTYEVLPTRGHSPTSTKVGLAAVPTAACYVDDVLRPRSLSGSSTDPRSGGAPGHRRPPRPPSPLPRGARGRGGRRRRSIHRTLGPGRGCGPRRRSFRPARRRPHRRAVLRPHRSWRRSHQPVHQGVLDGPRSRMARPRRGGSECSPRAGCSRRRPLADRRPGRRTYRGERSVPSGGGAPRGRCPSLSGLSRPGPCGSQTSANSCSCP